MIRLRNCLAVLGTEQHQAARRTCIRALLIECQCAELSKLADEKVDTSCGFNLSLIVLAILMNILKVILVAKGVNVFGFHVHLVKKHALESRDSAWRYGCINREEISDVKHHHILKVNLAFLVKLHKHGIYTQGVVSGSESQCALSLQLHRLGDGIGNVHSHFLRAFIARLKNASVDLLIARQRCLLYLTRRSIVPLGYSDQLDLTTEISFHHLFQIFMQTYNIYLY